MDSITALTQLNTALGLQDLAWSEDELRSELI
jgi:hypothetical protein